ncbi:MAG: ABC transporter ATP-binding protein [Solirubrobacteraceae bacterium]
MGLIEVDGLTVSLRVGAGMRTVLRDVSLEIGAGEALGLVGESGSGKSMTARAIGRVLPAKAQVSGAVRFAGGDALASTGRELQAQRLGIAMIFQDPRAHINPVRRVGDYVTEQLRSCLKVSGEQARARAIRLLGEVGIEDPAGCLHRYPHELSGGMLQRVMIAGALISEPSLILADEPTTALDVTTQAEVMAILDELRRDRGLSLLFITHDLNLAAAVCDRTAVMYAGQIVEVRTADRLHDDPLHPYTSALGAARPSVSGTATRLLAIPGRPLSAFEAPEGCAFISRCPHAGERCTQPQPLRKLDGGLVRCVRAGELRGSLGGLAHA